MRLPKYKSLPIGTAEKNIYEYLENWKLGDYARMVNITAYSWQHFHKDKKINRAEMLQATRLIQEKDLLPPEEIQKFQGFIYKGARAQILASFSGLALLEYEGIPCEPITGLNPEIIQNFEFRVKYKIIPKEVFSLITLSIKTVNKLLKQVEPIEDVITIRTIKEVNTDGYAPSNGPINGAQARWGVLPNSIRYKRLTGKFGIGPEQ